MKYCCNRYTGNTDITNTLRFTSIAGISMTEIKTFSDASDLRLRSKRMAKKTRYEPVEAHCNCIGKSDMECFRFESIPPSDYARCICTYDTDLDVAWPCFNISIWYEEKCNACIANGFCVPIKDYSIQSAAELPCLCRNRTTDSVSFENF
ncbi:unnamed protein product [Cercopithifilaria johnstoni]|uniref:Uncharacterized protein n=1 Tax=Cercopithifilaria johnstoni TaxID=2874296 RepID=A0A8J2PZR8_9BILA|nr:unnamed protein product [Cercopithifilaria johnstoni]